LKGFYHVAPLASIAEDWFVKLSLDYNTLIKNYNALVKNGFLTPSFSQEGEDKILDRLFPDKNQGFYVDIGAFHPFQYSNTLLFYLKGWRGINIDATHGSMHLFKDLRRQDINIECCITSDAREVQLDVYNEPALNSIISGRADEMPNQFYVTEQVKMDSRRLEDILDENLPSGVEIDFMNIDVEGADLEVMHSSNWTKYRPRVLVVEDGRFEIFNPNASKLFSFCQEEGYKIYAKLVNSLIFVEENFLIH